MKDLWKCELLRVAQVGRMSGQQKIERAEKGKFLHNKG